MLIVDTPHTHTTHTRATQVVLELIEVREVDLAREMLRSAAPLQLLRTEEPERYLTLDSLAQRPVFDTNAAYGTDGKERRRAKLAERLIPHAIVVPPRYSVGYRV